MSTTQPHPATVSTRALAWSAYASFVPTGMVTVLLAPLLPILSTRWSLDYSTAGALFPAQFMASTVAVALSGAMVSRWGFRVAIKSGLVLMGTSVALLLAGSKIQGIICIAGYGAGYGITVPAANLLVSEVNPVGRSAALNTLNFCWSLGAVLCPFLVAAADKSHHIGLLLAFIAGMALVIALGIALMPSSIVEPAGSRMSGNAISVSWSDPMVFVIAAMFCVYVGTETAFGGWVASYAKSLGTLSLPIALLMPSCFYGCLMIGRWLAPLVLRAVDEIHLAKAGVLTACAGMMWLLFSHSLLTVAGSACLAGLGLSSVYPITISLLSREFGSAAARVGSVAFTVANLGGSALPWLVGVSSQQLGSLKAGMAVPLLGAVGMLILYQRKWKPLSQTAQ